MTGRAFAAIIAGCVGIVAYGVILAILLGLGGKV